MFLNYKVSKIVTNGSTIKEKVVPKKKTQIPVKIKEIKSQDPQKKTVLKHKSLELALAQPKLDTELQNLLEATKIQFENNDVIMLKTALTFLNEKLILEKAEDLLFFDKPLAYPDNILPANLKSTLKELIQRCSDGNLQYFFHNLLQSLCEELNKSRSFIGHLILLQQIANNSPTVSISNLASTAILKNSYLNQPSICLSLFWALGTSGALDTTVGLKIWMEIIGTVTNVKSYTKFAFEYLHKILSVSERTPKLDISIEEYKSLVNVLLSSEPKTKLKDLQKIKTDCVKMLTEKFIKSVDAVKVESLFLLLLKFSRQSTDIFSQGIWECVAAYPEQSLNIWKMNFDTYQRQNVMIFNYLGEYFQVSGDDGIL